MAITSRSGMWRIYSAYYAARNGYPFSVNKYGKFRCADLATTIQFRPGWEPTIKAQVETCKGLFVDVGANIGFYTVMAAKKGNRVISFEPNPKAFECLLDNIKCNGVRDRVMPYRAAAWSRNCWLSLKQRGHTDVTQIIDKKGNVPAYTLDKILYGDRPSLIKIDAEDSEMEVLQGAQEVLKSRPKVIFEAWDIQRATRLAAMFPDGYKITQLDKTNYLAS